MEIAFVVPVRRLGRGVHHRPIGVVLEQEIGILGQLRDAVLPRSGDEPLWIALALDVPLLERISSTQRNLSAAVEHLAAWIEVLIDDDHRRTKIARANGGRQSGAAGADDDDVCLVVPSDRVKRGHSLRQRSSRRRQNRSSYAGGGSAHDEVASADGLLVLALSILLFRGHTFTSLEGGPKGPPLRSWFSCRRSWFSFFGAVIHEQLHSGLELRGTRDVERGAAVSVDRIHVHAEIDRQFHALEH